MYRKSQEKRLSTLEAVFFLHLNLQKYLVWTCSFLVCCIEAKIRHQIEGKRQKSVGVCGCTWETIKLIIEDTAVFMFCAVMLLCFFLLLVGPWYWPDRNPKSFTWTLLIWNYHVFKGRTSTVTNIFENQPIRCKIMFEVNIFLLTY